MPGLVKNPERVRKRKREEGGSSIRKVPRKTAGSPSGDDVETQILDIESRIQETGDYATSIKKILKIFVSPSQPGNARLAAAVSLCRVFYRLIASDALVKSKGLSQEERDSVDVLKTAYAKYVAGVCDLLGDSDEKMQSTALALLGRLVKVETSTSNETRNVRSWKSGVFASLVRTLISGQAVEAARNEFVETFVEENDDVRYYTFVAISRELAEQRENSKSTGAEAANALDLLLQIEGIPTSDDQLEDWYGAAPESPSNPLLSLKAHHKQAQETWLAVFASSIDKAQRKQILDVFTTRITPWFSRPEALMDFLTDSYDQGGATSLLALSGVYHLIREQNLDYPQFYPKLYSLLDDTVLHSKHRARFFRLLETFLASTHLPAALLASFLKRLARLALTAPPAAIVTLVPFTYNALKAHPQCSFMLHRVPPDPDAPDPFDMAEPDPLASGAIDSSLWELQSLGAHYHPNVATLARIVGEQFTKQAYHLEDFLDHSYAGLVEAELGKELKKTPVVEFEIPKRIFFDEDGGVNEQGRLLELAMAAAA